MNNTPTTRQPAGHDVAAAIHNGPGFYRAAQAAELLGISKSTFWLWTQQKFIRDIPVPQPIRLTPGVTVWKRREIHTFYDRLAELGDSTTPPEAA